MIRPAIRVDGLGKRYRVGGERLPYRTLRESLTDAARSLFRRNGDRRDGDDVFWALKDVSFEIQPGEVVGIIGRNGAGKSTLLKILSRITEPTEGRVELRGRVASLLEVGTGFHPELTGRENIFLNGAVLGMTRREIQRQFDEIVAFAEVEKFIDTPVKRYSSGMYLRLAFAVAAHLQPEILLVDEVLAVGDLAFQQKCMGRMQTVAGEGRTVLFVSHNMAAVRAICRSAIWLERGGVRDVGPVERVVQDYTALNAIDAARTKDIFPVHVPSHGISILDCRASMVDREDGFQDLKLTATVRADTPIRDIGVGFLLRTLDGVTAAHLGPIITGWRTSLNRTPRTFEFRCDGIQRYLAGGTYLGTLILSRPRIENICRLEDVFSFDIEALDLYGSSALYSYRHFGLVPLPCTFEEQDDAARASDARSRQVVDGGLNHGSR